MSKNTLDDIKFIEGYDVSKHDIHVDEITTGYLKANGIQYKITEGGNWWTKDGRTYKPPKCKPFTLENILLLIEKNDPSVNTILHTKFVPNVDDYWSDVVYK